MIAKSRLLIFILLSLISFSCRKETFKIGITQWISNPQYEKNIEGFKKTLETKGFLEGENIKYIMRNPEADKDKQKQIINEFIKMDVNLIYSLTTTGTAIVKSMVIDKPIVFSIVTYPVKAKIIASLEKSKNNLVGSRNYIPPSRQYYVLESIHPNIRTLAFVHRKGEINSKIQFKEFQKILKKRNIKVLDIAVETVDDIKKQLYHHVNEFDAIYSACDSLIQSGGEEAVIEFSKEQKKPSSTCNKDGVLKGALVGNIIDFFTIGKISGTKAAFILRGSEISWLRTESPIEDHIMINLKTAELLKVRIPRELLDRAKQIIKKNHEELAQ